MTYDTQTFLKKVTIFCDTAEQKNAHIIDALEQMKVAHEEKNLLFGDYSFCVDERDFSLSCVIERKANIEELYGNLTHDRDRLEREFRAASATAKDFSLLVENCAGIDAMRHYRLSDYVMRRDRRKVQNIGAFCYTTVQSWQAGNRYNFMTIYVQNPADTAAKMVEHFYWFWRNFKKLTANRKNMHKPG